MWIVPWDPFLMKKLLKSEICGFVNSARCALIGWKLFDKSNFAAIVHIQCINSNRNSKICPKTRKKKKQKNANVNASVYMNSNRNSKICPKTRKKKKQKNANVNASVGPKRTLSLLHELYLVFTRTFVPWLAVSLKVTDDPTRFDLSNPKWEDICSEALSNTERNSESAKK